MLSTNQKLAPLPDARIEKLILNTPASTNNQAFSKVWSGSFLRPDNIVQVGRTLRVEIVATTIVLTVVHCRFDRCDRIDRSFVQLY